MTLKYFVYLSFFTLLFYGCGEVSQHEPREEKSLYFVDAPTNGIDYFCGERSGVTKTYTQKGITKHGFFKCIYSPITFKLGSLNLGTIEDIRNQQTIYPQSLVPSFTGNFNNEEVLKIAILLQSLDDKSNPNYINISKSTKDKITLTTLKNISIAELNQTIQEMGFTPVSKEKAKIHLILNSPNVQSGKPTITPFEEDISLELRVGDVIGKLDITRGDADLIYPFILKGEGKEHFILNNSGKLILTQSLSEPTNFHMTVTAKNTFGFTTVPLTIHVQDSGRIGKVQMGRLKEAKIELFKLTKKNTLELVTTESSKSKGTLNQIGNFDLHTELLEDQNYYIYSVTEGTDIDSDDNGEKDKKGLKNHGKLRLIAKGIWIKNATNKIRITPLSEMLYSYIARDGFTNLEENLKSYAQILLKKPLGLQREIDAKDIIFFNPLQDKKQLYPTLRYNNTYNNIKEQLRSGNSIYKQSLFNAFIVDSFQSNAIEIVGSTIYTIDMLHSGEFNIYDLDSKVKIGGLKLPETPVEKDTHTLYINLLEGEARISSLEDWSYELLIHNQSKPVLDTQPFMKEALLSGSFSHVTLGKSPTFNLFGKEKQSHFYTITENLNKTQTIKFLNIDQHDIFYRFTFDSQLKCIDSLWVQGSYLYVIGDKKIHIFKENNREARLIKAYDKRVVKGDILGIEQNILYLLDKKLLILYDINTPTNPIFLEKINVPFEYKLGIKTNGKYITTGSKIIDIPSLRASKISN